MRGRPVEEGELTMVGVELGVNRGWLLNSHLSGTARRDGLQPEARIEALLILREELSTALGDVERELRSLAPRLGVAAVAGGGG